MNSSKNFAAFLLYFAVLGLAFMVNSATASAQEAKPLILHVKTSMSIDDAQICVVPNVAWAALSKKRPVIIVFDGSAVTSVAKGYGWRGWVGGSSTAMDRAGLPERERKSLADQLGVKLDKGSHQPSSQPGPSSDGLYSILEEFVGLRSAGGLVRDFRMWPIALVLTAGCGVG